MCHRKLCLILLFALVPATIGCGGERITTDALQGDWLFYDPEALCHYVEEFDCGYSHALSIRGDSLRYTGGHLSTDWLRFSIRGDTLLVSYQRPYQRPATVRLPVVALKDDRLSLTSDPELFLRRLPDTTQYVRARHHCGDTGLHRIAFSQGLCTHGPCPDFDVELDREGNYFFRGYELTKAEGTYSAADASDLFRKIHALVSCQPVQTLPPVFMEEGSIGAALVLWFDDEVVYFRGDVLDFEGLYLVVDILASSPHNLDLVPTPAREIASRHLLVTGTLNVNGGT